MNITKIDGKPDNYKADLENFAYECAMDQVQAFKPSARALEVALFANEVVNLICTGFDQMCQNMPMLNFKSKIFSTVACDMIEGHFLRQTQLVDLTKKEIQSKANERKAMCEQLVEKSDGTTKAFKKILGKIWKKTLVDIASAREISLVKKKSVFTDPSMISKVKESNCFYYALVKINCPLAEMFYAKGDHLNLLKTIENLKSISRQEHVRALGAFNKAVRVQNSLNIFTPFIDGLINNLGYQVVPKHQKGDLLIYLNKDKDFTHFAVGYDDKLIESKWGTLSIYRHSLEDTPYEGSILILRPPHKL